MKYKHHLKQGSSVLLVLLLTTVLIIWSTSLWRNTTHMMDIVHKRYQYEQLFRVAESLLNYGIVWCREHVNDLLLDDKEKKKDHIIDVGLWPPGMHEQYEGTLQINVKNMCINLCAKLRNDNRVIYAMHCTLEAITKRVGKDNKHQATMIKIRDWSINRT